MEAGEDVLAVLEKVAEAISVVLEGLSDWGLAGTDKPSQYFSDLAADEVALEILAEAGYGVLSEESGLHDRHREILVVLDPVDGSTNAARGIPWFATSLCALDAAGPPDGGVAGAFRDGQPIRAASTTAAGEAVVGVSGYPPRHLGWRQFRALGSAALDLCAVADGTLDAYVDCSSDAHGPWDYLGGLLVCREAGAAVGDASGRDLVTRGHGERRTPCAAASEELLTQLLAARNAACAKSD